MIFKIKTMTADVIPHVYVRVFAAKSENSTFAALGNLTMDKAEWDAFQKLLSGDKNVKCVVEPTIMEASDDS